MTSRMKLELTYRISRRLDGADEVVFTLLRNVVGRIPLSLGSFHAGAMHAADGYLYRYWYAWRNLPECDRLAVLSVARDDCIDRGLIAG